MIDSTVGLIRAAATPCEKRAATSRSALDARPHAADVTTNKATPMAKTRRLPIRSPRRPALINKTEKVSPYPATTHSRALELA